MPRARGRGFFEHRAQQDHRSEEGRTVLLSEQQMESAQRCSIYSPAVDPPAAVLYLSHVTQACLLNVTVEMETCVAFVHANIIPHSYIIEIEVVCDFRCQLDGRHIDAEFIWVEGR